VNRYPGQFPADPQAVGKTSRFTRFLVSGDSVAPAKLVQTRDGLARVTAYVERLARAGDQVGVDQGERTKVRAERKESLRADDLRERLNQIGTAAGRARVEAVLPYPRFETAPGRPGHFVRIEADGTRTLGRFVKRAWVTVADEPSEK
jgi:hypothetical protein